MSAYTHRTDSDARATPKRLALIRRDDFRRRSKRPTSW